MFARQSSALLKEITVSDNNNIAKIELTLTANYWTKINTNYVRKIAIRYCKCAKYKSKVVLQNKMIDLIACND